MPAIFEKIDRIKPFYDLTYKVVLFVCKVLLVIDIAITSMAVADVYKRQPLTISWQTEFKFLP